ncbi:MAG: hypothetical protein S4CHLAM102_05560 [Chlamydiia bacterium]|nr:hypothetical protein [Chlamydiia bacterium]
MSPAQTLALPSPVHEMEMSLELSQEESDRLKGLLQEGAKESGLSAEQFSEDFLKLSQITSQVKSIQKQGTLLIGERVFRAREILKKYGKQKPFTKWLSEMFTSRKTAYNALAYYEFYHKLPSDELRCKYTQLPAKASYILASRKGSEEVKHQILEEYSQEKQSLLISEIQRKLPNRRLVPETDEKGANPLFDEFHILLDKLEKQLRHMTSDDLAQVEHIRFRLENIIGY